MAAALVSCLCLAWHRSGPNAVRGCQGEASGMDFTRVWRWTDARPAAVVWISTREVARSTVGTWVGGGYGGTCMMLGMSSGG